MTSFIESSRTVQINITATVILLFCFFIILRTQQNHHHSPILHQTVGTIGSVFYFGFFVMLMLVRSHSIEETEMPGILEFVASLPLLIYFALFAAGLIILIYESIYDRKILHSYLSEYSILQAVNDLTDGLAVFNKNKRIVFANQKMFDLSWAIFGQTLYRFASFSELINTGYCAEDVHCLPQLAHPTYYLPSGEIWQIRQLKITVDGDEYDEYIASNITQQYDLRHQIEHENALLKKRQDLIAQSAKMVIESNTKEEQLAYKMRIHDSLGQCVTTVSHIMQDTEDVKASAKIWKETVEGLRTFEDVSSNENAERAFREQIRLIEQLGCTVNHDGPMPKRTLHAQIFRDAIRTAAINAVRHAKANTLFVKTKREDSIFDISIWDDGEKQIESITEGGGLSSLRQKIETAGGTMTVTADNGIMIHIVLPPPAKMNIL